MRHELKIMNPGPHLADKKNLFKGLYAEVDTAVTRLDLTQLLLKEKWRQTRKVVGEYVGNLYRHDPLASFVQLELTWPDERTLELTLFHDGQPFDQRTGVETIRAGLKALGAEYTIAQGSSGTYEGFTLRISM